MRQSEWQDGNVSTLGVWFGQRSHLDERLLLLFNAGETAQTFSLPAPPADKPWVRQLDSSLDRLEPMSLGHARTYRVEASSVALLEC